ncbi:aminotransferase-like domain-containing protein [Bradyrhizobium sp. 2TAF24]|uniref:aminotransferase-like domain-containing protein n=1 Tax=Bradyrhizobium sp. 2TAF24 TaxID=3233011 RepID=UPI003F8F384A
MVIDTFAERIERGQMRGGERLPSIRSAAQAFGVSKNTMVDAYERLVATGLIESRPGSGFYVSQRRAKAAVVPTPVAVDAVDSVWLLREQLEKRYAVRVGDGRPPPAWTEGSEVGRYLRPVNKPGQRTIPESYGSPYGLLPLRARLAGLLAERAITATPAQLLMTHGANDALDMIVRHFVEPGDAVLVDSPGYYPLFGKLRLAKARLVGVRRQADGPDPDDLAAQAAASGARLFFTQSLAHNPTGCSISLPVAYRVMRVATDHNLIIVDSDPFADVMPASQPRLAALDGLDRVIVVGTFAKTLSASLRSGYIAARADIAAALADLKMITRTNSSGYVEQIVHDLIVSGRYRGHVKRLAGRIREATHRAHETLARLGLSCLGEPSGGFYMWCELPAHIDDEELSRRAAERGILLAPGSAFHPGGNETRPAMRLNIAYLQDPRFEEFMQAQLRAPVETGKTPARKPRPQP